MDGFDAVWVLPGSPYRSERSVLAAIRAAREGGIPFLGTCGGFQHALDDDGTRAHPLSTGLASAAVDRVGAR